jgi:hypothetical protein
MPRERRPARNPVPDLPDRAPPGRRRPDQRVPASHLTEPRNH